MEAFRGLCTLFCYERAGGVEDSKLFTLCGVYAGKVCCEIPNLQKIASFLSEKGSIWKKVNADTGKMKIWYLRELFFYIDPMPKL